MDVYFSAPFIPFLLAVLRLKRVTANLMWAGSLLVCKNCSTRLLIYLKPMGYVAKVEFLLNELGCQRESTLAYFHF